MTLDEIAAELSRRLNRSSCAMTDGRRPVFGRGHRRPTASGATNCSSHEYFHGDTGAGLGASHQTGWTALVAKLLEQTSGASGHRDVRLSPEAAEAVSAAAAGGPTATQGG